MRKLAVIIIAVSFLLQGCVLSNIVTLQLDKGGSEEMATEWFKAVENGDMGTLQHILDQKVDINAQDSNNRTALMIATYKQNVEVAKLLMDAGADVNIQDDRLNTPFLYAGAEGYLDILQLTIQAGADPTILNRYGGTALIPAAEHGHVEIIKELLSNTQININHINKLGWTALMEAIILNNGNSTQQTVVQLLIEYGADVNISDHDDVTPLQHAKQRGFKEIEQLLLAAGAV